MSWTLACQILCMMSLLTAEVPPKIPEGPLFHKYLHELQVFGGPDELWCFVGVRCTAYQPGGSYGGPYSGAFFSAKERHVIRFDGSKAIHTSQFGAMDSEHDYFHPSLFHIMRFENSFYFLSMPEYAGARLYHWDGRKAKLVDPKETGRVACLAGLDLHHIQIWEHADKQTAVTGWKQLVEAWEIPKEGQKFRWLGRDYTIKEQISGDQKQVRLSWKDGDTSKSIDLASFDDFESRPISDEELAELRYFIETSR